MKGRDSQLCYSEIKKSDKGNNKCLHGGVFPGFFPGLCMGEGCGRSPANIEPRDEAVVTHHEVRA